MVLTNGVPLFTVANTPVVEGIVDYEEQYLYSSARDYAGEKGLLEIEIIQ